MSNALAEIKIAMAGSTLDHLISVRRSAHPMIPDPAHREVCNGILTPLQEIFETIDFDLRYAAIKIHAKHGPPPSSKVMNRVALHVGRTYSFNIFATFFRENIYGSKFVSAFRQYSYHQIWERYNRPNLHVSGFGELTIEVERKLKGIHSQLKGVSLVKNGELPDTVLAVLQEIV